MKVIVTVREDPNNIMEFDSADSGLSQEELARNIYIVAKEWIDKFDNERKISDSR